MIHTAKINEEHIVDASIETDTHSYLLENGYPVDVQNRWNVINHKQDDENSGYIVQEVKTLTKPTDQADIVADEFTILTCTCPAYRYGDGIPDLDEHSIEEWLPCKHCKAVDKSLKAKADDQQETITGP